MQSMSNKRQKTEHCLRNAVCRTIATTRSDPDLKYDSLRGSQDNAKMTMPQNTAELDDIGMVEVLEQDPRPTFVVDLWDSDADGETLKPVFVNSSLRSFELLSDVIVGNESAESNGFLGTETYQQFCTWSTSVTKFDDSGDVFPLSSFYCDILWTASTIRKRWRLVSGNRFYQTAHLKSGDLSSLPPLRSGVEQRATDKLHHKVREAALNNTCGKDIAERCAQVVTQDSNQMEEPPGAKPCLPKTRGLHGPSRSSSSGAGTRSDGGQTMVSAVSSVQAEVPDWTVPNPTGPLSPYLRLCRSIDWGKTSLGPMNSWTPEFRQIANLMMANANPVALFWSDEYTLFYNEAYSVSVAGEKHPGMLGMKFFGAFEAMWDDVSPIFMEARRSGKSVVMRDQRLPIQRYGFVEETFFTWTLAPVYCGETILGLWCAPFETTGQKISDRRMHLLRRLGDGIALARTVGGFWKSVLASLEEEKWDVPVALLYSVVEEVDDSNVSPHFSNPAHAISQKICVFEGSLGIPNGHPAAPPRLDLRRGSNGFSAYFREAVQFPEPTRLSVDDGTLPTALMEGIEWRGYREPCRDVIILPVRPTTSDNVLGFLLLGINPRRPYDEDYESFINMLGRQLATSLASIILFRDEQKAAADERQHLSMQLQRQTERMRRMTELAPVGMFYIDPDGFVLEANDRWFEITQHAKVPYEMPWMNVLDTDSLPLMSAGWEVLTVQRQSWSGELKLKHQWSDPESKTSMDCWILAMAQPEFSPSGDLISVMGCIADISQIKWAQDMQAHRLAEAEETRRQQNNFIDITSHEMRNPLSAVLQCAEDIYTTLRDYSSGEPKILPVDVAENCIEAAETIEMCAQHQKGIVDDILTVSKLDSDLLVITPLVVQPAAVIRRAMKIFEAEVQKKDIRMNFIVEECCKKLGVDWVALDPSRVLQIFINLMTNAIKFTQGEAIRSIVVRLKASTDAPVEKKPGFEYIPPKIPPSKNSRFDGADWGQGDFVFLYFEVRDTGRGLNEDEKKLLFQRFSQASPRTHAQYGGSGLGLFISRQLTELHGGQIGVASEAGVGSTFAFYVRVRRSTATHSNDSFLETAQDPYLRRESTSAGGSGDTGRTSPSSSSQHGKTCFIPKDLHILVVEDNVVNQKVLRKQLQKLGCTVNVACHGGEALEYLKQTIYWEGNQGTGEQLSIILMDWEMPIMDGLTCVTKIRSLEKEGKVVGHIPIIAVTANVRTEQMNSARNAGMDAVVSKPFGIAELMGQIQQLLAPKQ